MEYAVDALDGEESPDSHYLAMLAVHAEQQPGLKVGGPSVEMREVAAYVEKELDEETRRNVRRLIMTYREWWETFDKYCKIADYDFSIQGERQ